MEQGKNRDPRDARDCTDLLAVEDGIRAAIDLDS